MKQILTIIIISALFISCSESKPNIDNTDIATDTTNAIIIETNAYLYGNNGDTILLNLQNTNQDITGALSILPFEKDSRMGTIHAGKMKIGRAHV